MDYVKVTFTPTKDMPIYQGSCPVDDPVTGKQTKVLIIMSEKGEYELPRDKAAQVCADFPENFSTKDKLSWMDRRLQGGTIYLSPGEGVPSKVPSKTRSEAAPSGTK